MELLLLKSARNRVITSDARLPSRIALSKTDTFFIADDWLRSTSATSSTYRYGVSALADREVEMIEAALAECRGRISGPSGAVMKLRIPRQTLESKIRRLGIDKNGLKVKLAALTSTLQTEVAESSSFAEFAARFQRDCARMESLVDRLRRETAVAVDVLRADLT